MNTDVRNAFINATLAEAAYVNGLIPGLTGTSLAAALRGELTAPLADYIGQRFTVVSQVGDFPSGFSVTVFRENATGQRYISFRGTQDIQDFAADADLAIGSGLAYRQVIAMVNWAMRASTPQSAQAIQLANTWHFVAGELVLDTYSVEGTGEISGSPDYVVNGHSLGGHLTTAFARLFGNSSTQSFTYNGAGFLGSANRIFSIIERSLGIGATAYPGPFRQKNYFAEHGVNFATNAGWSTQFGERMALFNEEGIGLANHRSYKLTDALALCDVMGNIDNQLSLADATRILDAGSDVANQSLEKILDALRRLCRRSDSTPTQIGDAPDAAASRVDYQSKLAAFRELVEGDPSLRGNFISLASKTSGVLATLASQDIGYRYALKELNPFAILSNGEIYAQHNQNGELDLYNTFGNTPAGMTQQYLADRAAMLAWKNLDYAADGKRALRSKQIFTYDFTDKTLKDANGNDLTFRVVGTQQSAVSTPVKVVFGSDQGETLTGGDVAVGDRLYGDGGDDTLIGNGGSDYLEGGQGSDTYVYSSGDGHDTILDTDGLGKIVFDGVILDGGRRLAAGDYISSDKHFQYELLGDVTTGGTLFINGDIRIENFKNGDLGIHLSDASALPGIQPTGQIFFAEISGPFGNHGDDFIASGGTWTTIIGENGDDLLVQGTLELGISGNDFHGNAGDDVLVLGPNEESMGSDAVGGPGEDIILGGDQADIIYGDMIFASADGDAGTIRVDEFRFSDGSGNFSSEFTGSDPRFPSGIVSSFDVALNFALGIMSATDISTLYDDFVDGGLGDDSIVGGYGADTLIGGGGNDRIVGDIRGISGLGGSLRPGNFASLFGSPGDDYLDGGDGDDTLADKDGGNDTFFGGNDNDVITSVDPLNGSIVYENNLEGDDGNDFLTSDNRSIGGFDTLLGGAGNDALSSVYGNALFDGGPGNDIYAITRGHVGQIVIQDHDSNPGNLDRLVFGTLRRVQSDAPEGTTGNLDANWFLVNGILPSQVGITRDESNLYLSVDGVPDKITLLNWFVSDDDGIEEVRFENGTVWDAAALTAMATSADPDIGTADDDVLIGIDGVKNSLSGNSGDDTLIGGDANDVFNGGPGSDAIAGGAGSDTYVFNLGDGIDHIVDNEGSNTVQFGPGITADMLSLGLGSFLIQVGAGGDAIHLDNFDSGDVLGVRGVDTFQFNDGANLTYANLIARGFDVIGTEGNDFLAGTNVDDRFDGGAGNDTLIGGAGNDAYLFGLGSGQDRIEDFDATTGNSDILRIGAGVLPDDLAISRTNDDLLVKINGIQDQVTIANWFQGDANKIERVTFADGTEWNAATLEGKVVVPNTPPSVADAIADQATSEGAAFSYTVAANTFADSNVGDTLALSATRSDGSALPSWLAFNAATRTFSGNPLNADVGTLSFRVTATDSGGLSAFATFDIAVANTNDAPVAVADSIAVTENATTSNLVPMLLANDSDDDAGDSRRITIVDTTNIVGMVNFDAGTQTLTYAASQDALAVGATTLDHFTYTIADGAGATATAIVTVTVTGVNDAPTLAQTIVDQAVAQDAAFTFKMPLNTFVDADFGSTLNYSAALTNGAALPGWLTFDPATHSLSGTPHNGDVGSNSIKLTATDAGGLSVSDTFDLTIMNVNDAPTLVNSIADQSVLQDQVLHFQLPANTFADIDAVYGDTLTETAMLVSGAPLPDWLTFDPATHAFNGTPRSGDVGSHNLMLTSTDSGGLTVSSNFELIVEGAKVAPVAVDDAVSGSVNDSSGDLTATATISAAEPNAFIAAYNVLTPAGENTVVTQLSGSSNPIDDTLVRETTKAVTSANASLGMSQTPDESLQQEIQARIDSWFGEAQYQQAINLSEFGQVPDHASPITQGAPGSVTYNVAQWNGIELNLPLHLAKYADSGLDPASENLFSNAIAISSIDAVTVANMVDLSPASGIDLKPLKGLNEGLTRLEYA